ncbi:MAG: DUF882 domain-containing protein [Myxococcota bacterium]
MGASRQLVGGMLASAVFGCALGLLAPPVAQGQRVHEVQDGQTLSHIAHEHHVSVASLRAANGLREGEMLRPGQSLTVPRRGTIFVRRGQTLSHIARGHDVSVGDLARANRIDRNAPLREGQRLVLPGFDERSRRAARRWGRPDRPGVVKMTRVATGERLTMRLLNTRGRVRPAAQERMARLLRDRRTGEKHRIHPTLLRLLPRISDHFGGRRMYIISGYRDADAHRFTSGESRHTEGRAIDFRVAGVPNKVLRNYCRRLGSVGVGYYPRSTFIHLDVRKEPGYWVDRSRAGQKPKYRRAKASDKVDPEADEEPDETSAKGSKRQDEPSGA